MDIKNCGKCQIEKSTDQFHKKIERNGKQTYQSYCKKCCAIRHKEYYHKNKEYYFKKAKKHDLSVKMFINSLKNKPCVDCAKSYPPYVMDFDHRDPTQKEIGIAIARNRGWGKNRLLKEVAKCDLVCSNCHRERTFGNKNMVI